MCQSCGPRTLVPVDQLSAEERKVVNAAFKASERAYCPYSNFPVGAAILAENSQGRRKLFHGCNVENASYGGTICAERTAGTRAVYEGYTKFILVSVLCAKAPGGSPCGLCRQFLREFGQHATVLNISDREKSVVRWTMDDLLPDSFGPESLT